MGDFLKDRMFNSDLEVLDPDIAVILHLRYIHLLQNQSRRMRKGGTNLDKQCIEPLYHSLDYLTSKGAIMIVSAGLPQSHICAFASIS